MFETLKNSKGSMKAAFTAAAAIGLVALGMTTAIPTAEAYTPGFPAGSSSSVIFNNSAIHNNGGDSVCRSGPNYNPTACHEQGQILAGAIGLGGLAMVVSGIAAVARSRLDHMGDPRDGNYFRQGGKVLGGVLLAHVGFSMPPAPPPEAPPPEAPVTAPLQQEIVPPAAGPVIQRDTEGKPLGVRVTAADMTKGSFLQWNAEGQPLPITLIVPRVAAGTPVP